MADNSWRAARTITVFSPRLLAAESASSNFTFVSASIREPEMNTTCHWFAMTVGVHVYVYYWIFYIKNKYLRW